MRLIEALNLLREPRPDGAGAFPVYLGCGFTPLDLKTFLQAHLQLRLKDRAVAITTGLYGDLAGELERLEAARYSAIAVVVEWSDLDPRLGLRTAGGWRIGCLDDMARSVEAQIERLGRVTSMLSSHTPVALLLPTLPLPPVCYTPRAQTGMLEARLRAAVDQFALSAAALPGCRVISREAVDSLSPLGGRSDARTDLAAGFPYTSSHADVIGSLLASVITPAPPRKGLITDLDDTLWLGIVGETGVEGLRWTLEGHAQLHGLYQQLLQSLADAGVLLGVASKNDPQLAVQALRQPELFCGAESFSAIEASWQPKSAAVGRILQKWNVAPDAVVFVDDSPLEVAEVEAAFPAMECRLFPKHDPAAAVRLMVELRDLFGRSSITEEDRLRSASIQQTGIPSGTGADFLARLDAVVSFSFAAAPNDSRPFDLINKTNQFNLNGRRLQEADWRRWCEDPEALILVARYRDRFGPLGRIAVLLGRRVDRQVEIAHWVMSCRAFSRHIEYACLRQVFEHTDTGQLRLAYTATPRNGPLREFLATVLGAVPDGECVLSKARFLDACPKLFHKVETAS